MRILNQQPSVQNLRHQFRHHHHNHHYHPCNITDDGHHQHFNESSNSSSSSSGMLDDDLDSLSSGSSSQNFHGGGDSLQADDQLRTVHAANLTFHYQQQDDKQQTVGEEGESVTKRTTTSIFNMNNNTTITSTMRAIVEKMEEGFQTIFPPTTSAAIQLDRYDRNLTMTTAGGNNMLGVNPTLFPAAKYAAEVSASIATTVIQGGQEGQGGQVGRGELWEMWEAEVLSRTTFQRFLYSIIIPLLLLLCILSSLINLTIVLSVRWCRRPMSPTLYFSISLALADAFATILLGTGLVVNSLLPKVFNFFPLSNCFPLAVEALRLGGVLVAVTHLLALAINHWMGIVRPLHYESTMTRGTALRIIILSWICPIVLLLLLFSKSTNEGFRSPYCQENQFLSERTFRGIFASLFFAPLIAMTFIYWHIFIIVRNHLHYRLKYQRQPVNDPQMLVPMKNNCQQLRRNVKAAVTTVLILGTYIVGWMPAILWYIIVCDDCILPIEDVPRGVIIPVNVVLNTLLILKAFLDPIIYAARMSDIQIALKKMRYDCLLWLFGGCVPPPRTLDTVALGSVRFTKSFRMSSRGSSSRSNV